MNSQLFAPNMAETNQVLDVSCNTYPQQHTGQGPSTNYLIPKKGEGSDKEFILHV